MKTGASYIVILLFLHAAPDARADIVLAGDEARTQISGKYFHDVVTLGSDTDSAALFEVETAEYADVPCRFKVRRRDLNSLANSQYVNTGDSNRDCDGTDRSTEVLTFTDTDTFVRGVQVCLNDGGDRVKGVRIFGAKIDRATGELANVPASKEFTRRHCNDRNWKAAVYCPAGQIATKLRVSGTGKYNNVEEIAGLGLMCRAPVLP